MAKSICFINEKGGIGKTTSCFNMAWEMSKEDRIILIDLDGQGSNLTYFCGIDNEANIPTICDILVRDTAPKDVILNVKENLDIIPATNEVTGIDQRMKVSKFRALLNRLKESYDYIFIDVCPSAVYSQYLALTSVDSVVIPIMPATTSMKAMRGVTDSIEEVKDTVNPGLAVLGLLFVRFNKNTIVSRKTVEVSEGIKDSFSSDFDYEVIGK